MNRKKKICIVIIIVLTFVILGNLLLFFTKKDIEVAENQENQLQEENIATEDSINNVIDENTITQNEVTENTAIAEAQDTMADSNVNNTKKVTVESTPKVAQNSKSQVTVVPKKETATETQVAEKQETQEDKQEETKEESSSQVSQTNVEKYVRNDSMISRIKQVIQNNETQDMKTFGYNIIVDSSIKNKTNQFTFAESRVINAIRLKFGTIRIYAEDYYYNEQLIMTECYIL